MFCSKHMNAPTDIQKAFDTIGGTTQQKEAERLYALELMADVISIEAKDIEKQRKSDLQRSAPKLIKLLPIPSHYQNKTQQPLPLATDNVGPAAMDFKPWQPVPP
jgi:hypothetical protein